MMSVEQFKQQYFEGKDEENMQIIMGCIENKLKQTPFRLGSCFVTVPFLIEQKNADKITAHLKSLGYVDIQFGVDKYENSVIRLSWDSHTEDDRYYITMSTHPCGNFVVSCIREDSRIALDEMKHYGNYFKTKEKALEVAAKFNKILEEYRGS